jgi:hypothetical protein
MEHAMATHHVHQTQPVHDCLHPQVYRTMIALTVWLVLSIWVFFDRGAYFGLTLAMITVFFVIAVGIPVLIWKTWQHNAPADETREPDESYAAWASQSFATWTGQLSGSEATMQILLPLAAVSIGMFVFGLVYFFDVPSGAY